MTISSGTRLGPYEIVAPIGAGGMGEVYRARDTRLDRSVAVKILPVEFAENPQLKLRLEREAKTISQLNHPHICTLYDVGDNYLVMELLEGETLAERVKLGALPLRTVVEYATQIAAAVATAHERNIVHRDLKPENLFITCAGTLKVLDFGLAKGLPVAIGETASTEMRVTTPGVVVGTFAYMSPEQLKGQSVDARSDVFSIGVIILEMTTGRRVFQRTSFPETAAAILHDNPSLSELDSASPMLAQIVRRCIQKRAEERFRNAGELALALEAASAQPTRIVKPARARAIAAASIIAVLIAAAGLWSLRERTVPHSDASLRVRSLAILPFHSLQSDGGGDVFGAGFADTIITKVSQTGALTVRPTSAVRKYAHRDVDALSAAPELGVDSVLDGNMQRSGGRLRVSVNLLRAGDGMSLWADSFDLPDAELFALQDQVAMRVVEALRVTLTPAQREALAKRYTANAKAYEWYAKGSDAFDKRIGNLNQLRESIGFFQKAIAADSRYALAHAQLGYAYVWMALFFEPDDPRWIAAAKQELDEAERLDPTLAQTHVARHDLFWSASEGFQIERAVRELMIAQKLDPSAGHSELATIYYHLGLEQPAVRELRRALEIDPTSSVNRFHYVEGMSTLGRFAEAISANQTYYPGKGPGYDTGVILALLWTGRLDEAAVEIERVLKARPDAGWVLSQKGRLAALRGEFSSANAIVATALTKTIRGNRAYHHITYDAAAVSALQGRAADTARWLQATVDFGMPNYPLFARDPHLDRVRQSSEFRAFMSRLEPQWKRYQAEFR